MQRSRAYRGMAALLCVLSLGFAGCATTGEKVVPDANTDRITVKGNLAYRERIALPPDSTAQVAVSDTSIADRMAPVIAEEKMDLDHRQVPIPFELTAPVHPWTLPAYPRKRTAVRNKSSSCSVIIPDDA